VEIAIVSDTHMPRPGRRLPEECLERLRSAALIIHAGDLVTMAVLGELERLGEVIAVHGNVDDEAVRAALPGSRLVEIGSVKIGLVHDGGPARDRLERLRRRFADADAVVFGHSHMPLHAQAADGFQIFNPGSPTERRRAPRRTMGVAEVRGGAVTFRLLELG
jgi:putative phosphoesterase